MLFYIASLICRLYATPPTQLLPFNRYCLEEPLDEILLPNVTKRQLWITSFTHACEHFQSESCLLLWARQVQQDLFCA